MPAPDNMGARAQLGLGAGHTIEAPGSTTIGARAWSAPHGRDLPQQGDFVRAARRRSDRNLLERHLDEIGA